MTGYLIGYTGLVLGTVAVVYALTRRWEGRFRAAVTTALPRTDELGEVSPAEPDPSLVGGLDEPILVDPTTLRVLIRDAVREGLAPTGGQSRS
jgi:hypothetical protein